MVVTLYFYVERGGNQYGPRFHYEVFLFLVVFVAGHLFRPGALTLTASQRLLFALTVVSVALMPFSFAGHAVIEQHVIRERMDPFTRAATANLPPALVLIGGRVGSARSMSATRSHAQRHRSRRPACCSGWTWARPSTARPRPAFRIARRISTSGTTPGRSACCNRSSARERAPSIAKTLQRQTFGRAGTD